LRFLSPAHRGKLASARPDQLRRFKLVQSDLAQSTGVGRRPPGSVESFGAALFGIAAPL